MGVTSALRTAALARFERALAGRYRPPLVAPRDLGRYPSGVLRALLPGLLLALLLGCSGGHVSSDGGAPDANVDASETGVAEATTEFDGAGRHLSSLPGLIQYRLGRVVVVPGGIDTPDLSYLRPPTGFC